MDSASSMYHVSMVYSSLLERESYLSAVGHELNWLALVYILDCAYSHCAYVDLSEKSSWDALNSTDPVLVVYVAEFDYNWLTDALSSAILHLE